MSKVTRTGGAIKTSKASDVGFLDGYLVMFGDESSRDTDGQFFTPETDYGPLKSSIVLYHHGFDRTLKNQVLDASASIGIDDKGVWIRSQMDLRDEYKRAIYELAERGYLGWSAGTLPVHFEAEPDGRITKFFLGLDASLTPTPADIRNLTGTMDVELPSAVKSALESLIEQMDSVEAHGQAGEADTVASDSSSGLISELTKSTNEGDIVSDNNRVEPIASHDETVLEEPTATPAMSPDDVKQMIDGAIKSQTQSLADIVRQQIDEAIAADKPAIKAGFNINRNEAEEPRHEVIAKGWEQFIRSGDRQAWRETSRKAAMNEGTDSEGGFLVPVIYSDQLVRPINEGSYLRAAGANIIPVRGTDSFRVPTLTHTVAAVLTNEASAFDQQEPTLGEIEFTPYKYTRLSKVSEELLADSRFNVFNDILTPDGVYGFVQAENAAFTTGTGSSQPQGVVTGASVGVNLAGAAAITGDEIIDLFYSLEPEYQTRATWMMNSNTAGAIRQLKNPTSGDYLWQPALAAGAPPTILGRPIVINNSMADLGASAKPLLFGDLSFFWVADFAVDETGNTGIYVQRLNELYAANGQVGFRWFKRFDSHVMLSAAIKVAQNATA